jgi:hypothetical protein
MTLCKHLIASLFGALVVIPCSTLVFAQTVQKSPNPDRQPRASITTVSMTSIRSPALGSVIRSTALTPSLDLIRRGSNLMALKLSKNFGTAPCSSCPKSPAPMDLPA